MGGGCRERGGIGAFRRIGSARGAEEAEDPSRSKPKRSAGGAGEASRFRRRSTRPRWIGDRPLLQIVDDAADLVLAGCDRLPDELVLISGQLGLEMPHGRGRAAA